MGQRQELRLLLLSSGAGRRRQKLLATARISLAEVFASGEDVVSVPVMTRKGAFPLSVTLSLSVHNSVL